MLKVSKVIRNLTKNFSTTPNYVIEHLKHRSLLRVSGEDAATFLQGLITNDVHHLNSSVSNMFAMFLNNKGRVLYDTIIYRLEQNSYLVEVDSEISSLLQKHLKLFRVRKKVDISQCDKYNIWALFNPNSKLSENEASTGINDSKFNFTIKIVDEHLLLVFKDPRLHLLGYRVLACPESDSKVTKLYNCTTQPTYKLFRYNLGIGEGIDDLPPGNCLPLEANCDYLHGISFHKGCYVGQELTARTHHTGVIRKRLMPLFFESPPIQIQNDAIVYSGDTNVGKVRGFVQDTGLGLLRIAKVLNSNDLKVDSVSVKTVRPSWWPIEAPKLHSEKLITAEK